MSTLDQIRADVEASEAICEKALAETTGYNYALQAMKALPAANKTIRLLSKAFCHNCEFQGSCIANGDYWNCERLQYALDLAARELEVTE